jgi:acetyltransferase-like isoleucine patch superfamily enzyme
MKLNVLRALLRNPITLWAKWLLGYFCYRHKFAGQSLLIGYMANLTDCYFGIQNTIYDYAELSHTRVGDYSYVGPRSRITQTVIGKFTCIGPDVLIGLGLHPVRDYVSMHPAFFSTKCQAGFSFVSRTHFAEYRPCLIGNDVWVGARAIILDGVNVGDGAIIGAGAVVTKDVPSYAVVAGVPAKVLRFRFESHEIEHLRQFKWWDRDIQWLSENHELFQDVKNFMATNLSSDVQ